VLLASVRGGMHTSTLLCQPYSAIQTPELATKVLSVLQFNVDAASLLRSAQLHTTTTAAAVGLHFPEKVEAQAFDLPAS
jgi:hypothetical protein